ncbi:hypothetical protein WMY93_004419 [Mugilogobius chulae]|uniref:CPC1/SPEF2 domain-containing protein n=1 Tax=Mugilogobius chulae TaxID=88201 RepID=A0AAW0PZT2_9GOBI
MPLNQISIVQAPKPPPHLSQLNLRKQRQRKLAQDVQNEIAQFETNREKLPSSSLRHAGECNQSTDDPRVVSKPVPNSVYIQQIRQRLKEDTLTREQREKRVKDFLKSNLKHIKLSSMQSMKNQKAEGSHYQYPAVQRAADSAEEEMDSQESVKRKAVLAEQEKMARAEEIKWDLDFCKKLDAERDQLKHQKHAVRCKEIVEQIVDLATKVGESRLLLESM